MNADYPATFGAGPPLLFLSNEMPYAELPNALQIIYHAHSILRSVPFVQMVQAGTGKAVTVETVLGVGIHYLLTVLDMARNADFRLETVVASTAGACLSVSHIRETEATVHSAWCDLCRAHHVCLC